MKYIVALLLLLSVPAYAGSTYNPGPAVPVSVVNGGTGQSSLVRATAIGNGWQNIAQTNNFLNHVTNGTTQTQVTYRSSFIPVQSTNGISLCFSNCTMNGSFQCTGTGNPITLDAAIEYNSVTIPLYFSGQPSVVLANGSSICSDVGSYDIPAQTTAYWRASVTVGTGQKWSLNSLGSLASTYSNNGSDTTSGTGALANSGSGAYFFAPTAILGKTYPLSSNSVCIIGDSISSGTNDFYTSNGGTNTGGYIIRGLGGFSTPINYAWQNFGVPSTGLTQYLPTASNTWFTQQLSSCAYIISEGGINNIGSATAVQMEGYVTSLAQEAQARGIPFYQTTLTPKTTSTDYWQTTTNQTVTANETVRTAFNDWVRTKPSPLTGYIDAAGLIECNASNVVTTDGGRFCVFGTVQVTSTATSGSASTLVDTSQTWTTNQWANYNAVVTGGTGVGDVCSIISNTATTLTCGLVSSGWVTPDATSTYKIRYIPTTDGTHPQPYDDIVMAAAVAAVATSFVGH